MTCLKYEYIRTDADGVRWYRMIVVSATEPDFDGIDPADITGLPTPAGIAAGSVFLYPDNDGNGTYKIAYEDITQNGPGPDPEEDTMKVNLAYDSTAHTLTMDKTVDEIVTAINDGKIVTAVCNDADFLAAWTDIEGVTGAMSAHVTTSYALEGTGSIVDAISNNSADISAAPKQMSFLQEEGEGKYPVYTLQ